MQNRIYILILTYKIELMVNRAEQCMFKVCAKSWQILVV